MYHGLFIHSSIDEHLCCSHVLATVSNAACIFTNCGFFSGNMPGNRIAGSHGSFVFSFLRNLHPVLHSGCFSLLYFPSNRVAHGFLTQGFILERGSIGVVFFLNMLTGLEPLRTLGLVTRPARDTFYGLSLFISGKTWLPVSKGEQV